MTNMVLGVFTDRYEAENAKLDLRRAGYDAEDISIANRNVGEKGGRSSSKTGSSIARGAFSGLLAGAVIGAIVGLFTASGVINFPAIDQILVGQNIVSQLAVNAFWRILISSTITGGIIGGLIGGLLGLGFPAREERAYDERKETDGILLTVPTEEWDDRAREILENHGADQVRSVHVSL